MNTEATSLSRRPARRFWGWGSTDATLDAREQATVKFMVEQLGGHYATPTPPVVADFKLTPIAPGECGIEAPLISAQGMLRTLPFMGLGGAMGLDGFLAARLTKSFATWVSRSRR